MRRARFCLAALPLVFLACSSGDSGAPSGALPPDDPGTTVAATRSAEQEAALAELKQELDAVASLDATGLEQKHAVPFVTALGYDPTAATGLATIQGSTLALADDEKALLAQRGFAISDRHHFPSFAYGIAALYAEDLPLYISADSVLDAVHRSYDGILAAIEQAQLAPDLRAMLLAMRGRLAAGAAADFDPAVRADVDLYLAVALALLDGQAAAPVAGADPAQLASLVAGATAHQGAGAVSLFGTARELDFSQFTPRGHYTDTPELSRYFAAMMWLGRIELRLLETQQDGSQVFRRRQLDGAYALRALMEPASRAAWKRIDDTIGGFVGEHDSMTVPQLDALLADLGVAEAKGLAALPDAKIAQALAAGGYGAQRIASQLVVNGIGGTLPLSSSFLLFGQRYVVDSHVFSNVVYDRAGHGAVMRMMPDPLDVAFAALGNDHAAALLDPDLRQYAYAPDLEGMRILVDAHGEPYWSENLYNLWLGALRALSPTAEVAKPGDAGLPTAMATEAWGRRLLSTQLGSWAELRHDTILYAKQSYTSGAACSFPDAFVDPYPAFWARLVAFADRGKAIVGGLDLPNGGNLQNQVTGWFDALGGVAATLQGMAEAERAGAQLTQAQMDFVNQAVHQQNVCTSTIIDGWYAKLLFDMDAGTKLDPTIADVHTQYTDEGGNVVGRVLHVATGMPRLMVVTVDRCGAPAAYAGLALSYFEKTTEQFERLDDPAWTKEIQPATPPEVRWMSDLVTR